MSLEHSVISVLFTDHFHFVMNLHRINHQKVSSMGLFKCKKKPSIYLFTKHYVGNAWLLVRAVHGSFHSVTFISFIYNSKRNSAEDYSHSKRNIALKELKKQEPHQFRNAEK